MAYDLVVVGAGTAGIPAAAEAALRGSSVLLIDAADRIGGALHLSWAQMSAAGTRLQQERGIDDSPQRHFDDVMRLSKGAADAALVRLAVTEAPGTIEWLLANDFAMAPECPQVLYFHEPYPVARTYWGVDAGRSILAVLRQLLDRALASGRLQLRLRTRMVALHRDGPRVSGLTAVDAAGRQRTVTAPHVVLATGGFAGDPDLMRTLTGFPILSSAARTSDGSGMLVAAEAGGVIQGAEHVMPTFGGIEDPDAPGFAGPLSDLPVLTPQSRLPWEIIVNARGHRFVREDHPHAHERESALLRQPDLTFWIVYDQDIAGAAPPILPRWSATRLAAAWNHHPSFVRASSLAALAERCAMDPATLAATVDDYNQRRTAGQDRFGREHAPLPIAAAPFYAVRNRGSLVKSPAGLAVDDSLRVRTATGDVVTNLYAAGEVIGGSVLSGKAHVSGMSVTPALGFGRLLGRRLARTHDPHRATRHS